MRFNTIVRRITGIVLLLTALCVIPSVQARKIKTRHSITKVTAKALEQETSGRDKIFSAASDSILFCDSIRPAIRFYGFDKTVGSNMESFFITNGSDISIKRMEIEIIYTDMKGRQLHKRTHSLDCDFPAGETQRFDIKSWDTQKSFYFHQSVKPKRQATPFNVKINLLSVTPQNSQSNS